MLSIFVNLIIMALAGFISMAVPEGVLEVMAIIIVAINLVSAIIKLQRWEKKNK